MTSRERVNNAMRLKKVDRAPVMFQLSIGHYFLYFEKEPRTFNDFFPPYHLDTIKIVKQKTGKSKACLERLTNGAIDLGKRQAGDGIDAVLISSAFAGAGLISRNQCEEFVLPYEKRIVEGIQKN